MRAAHRNHDCRLRDFLWRGRRCISIENETLRAVFCADKGSDLIELLHKPTDTELLFQAPRGLGSVHDQASTPLEVGHFRDLFPGGWYLMLPNGPEPCEYRSARFGQHGRHRLIALEPVCDLPSVAQAAGRGTAIQLAPGATRQTRIEATTFIPTAPVSAVAWGGQIQQ